MYSGCHINYVCVELGMILAYGKVYVGPYNGRGDTKISFSCSARYLGGGIDHQVLGF